MFRRIGSGLAGLTLGGGEFLALGETANGLPLIIQRDMRTAFGRYPADFIAVSIRSFTIHSTILAVSGQGRIRR